MKNYKIAVLFSGGLDSSATLLKALEKSKDVLLCFFDYGQNPFKQELQSLMNICQWYKVDHKVFHLRENSLSAFLECSHTTGGTDEGQVGYSSTVPNRNLLFLTLLSSYCEKNGIPYIYAGFQNLMGKTGEAIQEKSMEDQVDNIIDKVNNSLYTENIHADQTTEFVNSAKKTIYYSTDKKVQVLTPLIDMDKVDVLQYLSDKGELIYITENSYTCYNGDETKNFWGRGCGQCTACENRKRAYTIFKKNYGGKV